MGAFHQFEVREPKIRKICSSNFRDRVVHHAICNLLEPILERRLIFDTYACRTGKGAHSAMTRAQAFCGRYHYFLKCDIRKYFESIDHDVLKKILRRHIKDARLISLIDKIVDHQAPGTIPGKSMPIGNLTSQHFANSYLSELDHYLKEKKQLHGYVRYMDDFISFSDSKEVLHALLVDIRKFVSRELKLELKESVTRIAPTTEGVPFLGFRIFKNLIRLQRPNLIRLRKNFKRREKQFLNGELDQKKFTNSMRSMFAHISYGDTLALRRKEFIESKSLA